MKKQMRRFANLVVAGVFLLGIADVVNARDYRGPRTATCITILHNNDGESKLINAPGQPNFGGIARFSAKVDELRSIATRGPKTGTYQQCGRRIALLLSSGDNFLAGPEFNASLVNGVPFFDSIALDYIGYDAFALGNHEFDFGPDILADFIEGFDRRDEKFLSANLDFRDEPRLQDLADRDRIASSRLIRARGVRIGIVGATTPKLRTISSPRDTIVLQDVAALVQAEIDALVEKRAKVIILISHLQNIEEDLDLIPQLKHVDIAIAGGGDELLASLDKDLLVPGDDEDKENNETGEQKPDGIPDSLYGPYPLWSKNADGDDVPVVTTNGDYKYVGNLVTVFDRTGTLLDVGEESGPKRVAGQEVPDGVNPDPFLQREVVAPVEASVAEIAANVIAQTEVALEGRRAPGVRTEETNLGNLLADAILWTGRERAAEFGLPEPDVALQNGGGIRNNNLLAEGASTTDTLDFTELNTFQIAPFSNFVSIVPAVSRETFKQTLERAVSAAPAAEGFFAQIAGFSFSYNPAADPQEQDNLGNITKEGSRVIDVVLDDGTVIVHDGSVVDGDDLTIATIDFLARGGDGYPLGGLFFEPVGVSYQQALFNYVVDPLDGLISAADYPEGGSGRITTVP